ncbi:hypothetical protein [Corynebacterium senegalense]|uniref:hypothetical protein n=1 Tax=Corynebacterium senegalense TaxID=2080750 RepID=UPI001FEBD714|nr:hypothetical protein [Corynebacterium senegalense]
MSNEQHDATTASVSADATPGSTPDSTADQGRFGVLVQPDLSYRRIIFDDAAARQLLASGGVEAEVEEAEAAFEQEGERYRALYNAGAAAAGEEPNPIASMARNTADTSNPDFLADPTRAIRGPVIFAAREGGNLGEGSIDALEQAIRALENYRDDETGEYELWHNAVVNRDGEASGEADQSE